MTTLMQANRQWSTRPDDERFLSLFDMQDHFDNLRQISRETVVSSRRIQAAPGGDSKEMVLLGPNGNPFTPTHWSFDQLSRLAGAPPGYLRGLPSPIAADCVNYGLQYSRDIEDVQLLLAVKNGHGTVRAATGPKYGRIWNADIIHGLTNNFGDGVSGDWKVPGEFGKDVEVTKQNTTLYAGDRDMFVFLADERNRIEVPNRRNGESGLMARGFFVWNSEVGSSTFGVSTFLFDYVCANRIVWGASDVKEFKLRHTAGAPDRFIEQVTPALQKYSNSSTSSILEGIAEAKKARVDDVEEFLQKRFSKKLTVELQNVHMNEEDRPIESLWDVATAITAHAKSIPYQAERVEMERKAGDIMRMAF